MSLMLQAAGPSGLVGAHGVPAALADPHYGDDPSDTLIWFDGFEYDCISVVQCENALGDNYATNSPTFTNNTDIVSGGRPGSAGSKVLEMRYGPGRTHNLVAERGFGGDIDHFFFQIWFKTSVGWDPTENVASGIKGFMFWHDEDEGVYPRYQWGVSSLDLDENCNNSGSEASPHFGGTGRSAISGAHCQSYVYAGRGANDEAPRWAGDASQPWGAGGFNDGEWHRVTCEIKAGSSPEYMKWWYDGILVWDDTSVSANYPRPNLLKWFGNFPNPGDEVTGEIYFDDLTTWKR